MTRCIRHAINSGHSTIVNSRGKVTLSSKSKSKVIKVPTLGLHLLAAVPKDLAKALTRS